MLSLDNSYNIDELRAIRRALVKSWPAIGRFSTSLN
jgi:hypothetical protein